MIAHAAAVDVAQSFVAQINAIILFPLIVLLSAVALLVFLYGGFQYVYGANEPAARATGQKHLMWGIVGLLVMVSAYAILTIAANTFDISVDDSAKGVFSGGYVPEASYSATRPDSSPGPFTDTPADSLVSDPTAAPLPGTRPVARPEVDPSREYTTAELQAMIIADYEENTNIDEAFYMTNVRAMTTDIPGVDRKQMIDEAYYFKNISEETRDRLLLTLE